MTKNVNESPQEFFKEPEPDTSTHVRQLLKQIGTVNIVIGVALLLCCCLVIYPVLKLCIACCYTDKKAAVVPLETVDIETNLKKRLAVSLK